MNKIYYTPLSTTLEYIQVIEKTNKYYMCYFKFRDILRHFKYWIDINVWEGELELVITLNKGLNVGKLIWGYILNKQIIEEIPFNKIISGEYNDRY